MKKLYTSLAALAATGLLAAPAQAETWDMPLAYAASNYHSVTAAEFAECVTTGTMGEIEIVTHPSGSLFAGADIKRAVQTGQVPIGERLLSGHANESALFGWDSIPFLVSSFDEHDKLHEIVRPKLEELLAEQNLALLYSVPWPPQGLYFNKEVTSAADMEGLKFRAYNNATSRLAELTGMAPVTIEAAELSQAFATGVAESMISSGATGYDRKVWESLSHFYEVDAWLPRNFVMVNADIWAETPDAQKAVIEGCAGLAQYAGEWRAKEYTNFTVTGLAENGMTVQRAGDQLMGDLRAVGETMTAEWLEETGETGQQIIDAFRAE